MRIASPTSSMTRPTYAVSSAPQGTFGATTPMTRLVAPAAAETQRSGGMGSRGFLEGVLTLSTFLLAGCKEIPAQLAEAGAKRVATETALVRNFPAPNVLGLSGSDTIATGLDGLASKAGDTVTAGGSTVVDQVVNGSLNQPLPACKFGDKIPPNVDTNDATSVDWSVIGLPGRQGCLVRWGETDPNNPQLPSLNFQVNGVQGGTLATIESPNGGACDPHNMPDVTTWTKKWGSINIDLITNPAQQGSWGFAEVAQGIFADARAAARFLSPELEQQVCRIAQERLSQARQAAGGKFDFRAALEVEGRIAGYTGGNLTVNGVFTALSKDPLVPPELLPLFKQ